MEIKKRKGGFNDYTANLSYGELVAIENAMADNHSGPIGDELFAGLKWFLDRLPEPGEEDEDEQAKRGEPAGDGSPASTDGLDDMLPDTDGSEGPDDESAAPDGGPAPTGKGKNAFPGADRPPEGGGDDADALLADPDDTPGSKAPPSPGF